MLKHKDSSFKLYFSISVTGILILEFGGIHGLLKKKNCSNALYYNILLGYLVSCSSMCSHLDFLL